MKKPVPLVLVAIATAAVVTAIVFAVIGLAAGRGSGPGPAAMPTASGTGTSTATAEPTRTASPGSAPASTSPGTQTPGGSGPLASGAQNAGTPAPVFTSSSIVGSVDCPVPGEGPNGSTGDSPLVALRWSSTGATTAFVGVSTTDAQAEPLAEVAASGTDSIGFPCPQASQQYTITLVGPGGTTSTTTTVVNSGYRP